MQKLTLSAIALAAMTGLAFAQAETTPDTSDLSSEAAQDHPGTDKKGMTDNPTAKPKTGDLADKEMKDAPGTKGGMTDDPTAEPDTGALSDSEDSSAQ